MLQVHHRLGDFEIIRLLGKGGMGEVYEAQQLNPSRRVALKVLAPWLADNEESLQRFLREAAVPAQLDHPNIVRIISTGKSEEGLAYYTMQLVRGISLAELFKRGNEIPLPGTLTAPTVSAVSESETPSQGAHPSPTPLPPQDTPPPALAEYRRDRYQLAARLGAQAARALADAHRQGFLHRDIKPSNMMVDQHGHLYLLDFGLTRARDSGAMATRPGTVLGTPWFMSPEQAQGKKVDQRSDLYSLGVALFQFVTGGKGPFTADRDDSEAVLAQVRAGAHQPLRFFAPDIPQELERIIQKAICPQIKRRYQDGTALAAELETFLAHQDRPRTPAVSKKVLLVGAALTLAVLGLVLTLRLWRGNREKDQGGKAPGANTALILPDDCQPFPEFLRKLPPGFSQALMNQEHKPLWHCRLFGQGKFARAPAQLLLPSPGNQPTLLAMDVKKNRWFEYAIEVNAPAGKPGENRLGVFFGWRNLEQRFFVVEVNETAGPGSPFGQVVVGLMQVHRAQGKEQEMVHFLPLPLAKTAIPLAKNKAWHKLTVRTAQKTLTITVDDRPSLVVDLTELAQADPRLGGLDPRGALGIWAWNCWLSGFRNGTITVLGDDNERK
jgi:serine/threonine protein kinase